MELLSKSYPTKEKTLKGMLVKGSQGKASSIIKDSVLQKCLLQWILKNPVLLVKLSVGGLRLPKVLKNMI
jgi:hypothetical protein